MTNSTAIGANAFVGTSNTIKMGTSNEATEFPGLVRVDALGQPGATSLCRNGSLQISTCTAGNFAEKHEEMIFLLREQNAQMLEQLKRQQSDIEALKVIVCTIDPSAAVCLKKVIE